MGVVEMGLGLGLRQQRLGHDCVSEDNEGGGGDEDDPQHESLVHVRVVYRKHPMEHRKRRRKIEQHPYRMEVVMEETRATIGLKDRCSRVYVLA